MFFIKILVTEEMVATTPIPVEEEPEDYDLDFIKVALGEHFHHHSLI